MRNWNDPKIRKSYLKSMTLRSTKVYNRELKNNGYLMVWIKICNMVDECCYYLRKEERETLHDCSRFIEWSK